MIDLPSPPDLLHVLSAFRVEGRFCDVSLEFAEAGRRRFLAHRVVLVAFSSFFADACEEDVVQGGGWRQVVVPSTIADDAMDFILAWMYDESPKIEFTLNEYEPCWKFLVNLRIAAESLGIHALWQYLDESLLTFEGACREAAVREHWKREGSVDRGREKPLQIGDGKESGGLRPEDVDDEILGDVDVDDVDDRLGDDDEWRPSLNASLPVSSSSMTMRSTTASMIEDIGQWTSAMTDQGTEYDGVFDDDDDDFFRDDPIAPVDDPRKSQSLGKGKKTLVAPDVSRRICRPPRIERSTKRRNYGDRSKVCQLRVACEKCAKLVPKYHMKEHVERHHGDNEGAKRRAKLERLDPVLSPCLGADRFRCPKCAFSTEKLTNPSKPAGENRYGDHQFWVLCAKHLFKEHGIVCPNLCFPCPREGCSAVLYGKAGLKNHLLAAHDESKTTSPCTVCGKAVKNLQSHILLLHKGDDQLPCPVCGKVFRNETYLKTHVKHAHGKRKFQCDACDTFSSHFELHYRHHRYSKHGILTPPNSPVFECDGCDYKSPCKSKVTTHQRKTHPASSTLITCKAPGCSKQYKSVALANRHYQGVHRSGYVSKCPHCELVFYSKSGLHYHLWRVHQIGRNGDVPSSVACQIAKPYQCGYCDHVTGLGSNMRKHVVNRHAGLPIEYVDLRKRLLLTKDLET